jgi:hypothetical protein
LCVPSMNRDVEVRVLWEPGRRDPSEPQGEGAGASRTGREAGAERSGERNRGSMNKNRIRGDGVQGERAHDREALATKGRRRKSGDRAAKAMVLTWGDLGLRLKGRRG